MATTEVKIPSPGESISEVEIASWFVETGDYVEKDQEIGEIESEKATLPLIAEDSGEIEILKQEGDTVAVGTVVCRIDSSKEGKKKEETGKDKRKEKKKPEEEKAEASEPKKEETEDLEDKDKIETQASEIADNSKVKSTPLARKLMEENELQLDDILKGLKKITTKEVKLAMGTGSPQEYIVRGKEEASREEKKDKMSNLRKKLSKRLVAVKNETAMLTTFNEADMTAIMDLRKKYQQKFTEKHGIKLGYMSFFTKAITEALKLFPRVNSRIEEDDVITPEYYDIGIAVQTDKGLMVPVIRNAESMSLAEIENNINTLAAKARKNRISIDDMAGGTFTITNGGIFGSMLSTPILNPPQSAILGMHNIMERPVAIKGKVEIRPMMYLALSYDHRIVDGRESVSFLVKVKELLENPGYMLFEGKDPDKLLLDL
ncbi:MAG: 2-oxoglutarate dehydrogenase complex dihydrolipoyllysine-residue succinyltransferase [Bacteroidota bacterium]